MAGVCTHTDPVWAPPPLTCIPGIHTLVTHYTQLCKILLVLLYSTDQAGSRWEWAAAVPCWDKLLSLYTTVHHCTPLHCTLLVDLSLGISVKILLALVTSANWEVENLLEFDLLVLESRVGMTVSHDSLLGNKIRKFLISLELNHRSWRNNKTSLRAQLTIEFILIVGQYLYTLSVLRELYSYTTKQ